MCRCGRDRALAEDLVQETFLKIWRVWPNKSEMIASRPGYEYTTLRRTIASHWRRVHAERASLEKSSDWTAQLPDDETIAEGIRTRLCVVLADLPLRHQEVLFMREYIGYSSADVGVILGLAPGTVDNYCSSAKRRIREALMGEHQR